MSSSKLPQSHSLDDNFSLSFLSPRTYNMDILLLSKEAIKTAGRLSDTYCEEIQIQVVFLYLFLSQYTLPGNTAAISFKFWACREKKKKMTAYCLMQNQKKTQFINTDHVNPNCLGWAVTLWWSAPNETSPSEASFQNMLASKDFCLAFAIKKTPQNP